MKSALIAAATIIAVAGSAMAQSPYGTVQFRWRERGVGLTNSVNLTPGVTPFSGAALDAITSPTVTSDARVVLVLEAKVTRATGNTDLRGFYGVNFHLVSSDSRTQGQFAAAVVGSGTDKRNLATATTAIATTPTPTGPGVVLPMGATILPGTDGLGDRGVFGPFRRVADLSGKNQPAIGVQNLSSTGPRATFATLENITAASSLDPLSFVDPDTGNNGAYFGRYDFYGLDTWVPVFTCVYNLADVSTARAIHLTSVIPNATQADPGLRGFRGVLNPQSLDSWILDGSIPDFIINVPGGTPCLPFTTNPANTNTCANNPVTLTSQASDGANPVTYKWQIQTPPGSGPWTDITTNTINLISGVNFSFTGRTTASLGITITAAPANLTGAVATFRSVATSTCGSNNSTGATLSLASPTQITSTLPNASICPAGFINLSATANAIGTVSTQWQIRDTNNTWLNLSTTPTAVGCSGGSTAYAFLIAPTAMSASLAIHGCPRYDFAVRGMVTDTGACAPAPTNTATIRNCPADVDCNGAFNLDDIFQFINMWFAGC
jgi:hypothetical protein